MEPMSATDYLSRIPFAIASLAELCTKPGSHEREIARRVAQAVRSDIDKAMAIIQNEDAARKGA